MVADSCAGPSSLGMGGGGLLGEISATGGEVTCVPSVLVIPFHTAEDGNSST